MGWSCGASRARASHGTGAPPIDAGPYHVGTDISSAATRGVVAIRDRLRAHARSTRVAKNPETLAERVAGIETVPFDPGGGRAFGEF